MSAPEPTRERVEAHEAALGCERRRNFEGPLPGRCITHRADWTDLGCPVAVAAARVEAERVAEIQLLLVDYTVDGASIILQQLQETRAERDALRAVVEQVRALHSQSEGSLGSKRIRCGSDGLLWPCTTVAILPEATS